ncbi:MAG: DUF7402 domain-containing protein, partial [Mycobacteriaceae bacterium]
MSLLPTHCRAHALRVMSRVLVALLAVGALSGATAARPSTAEAAQSTALSEPAPSSSPGCAGGALSIVGHTDDDLLFLSPDLLHDIQAKRCVRVVFTTAGEAGEGKSYWSSLESGSRAAYAQMAGVANSWTVSDAGVSGRSIVMQTLVGAPNVSLVFMRLPDGFPDGSGSSRYGFQSILKLWNGSLSSITPVDGSAPYTSNQFLAAVTELMTDFQPTSLRTQDWTGSYTNPYDHSDHWATAKYAEKANQQYTSAHTLTAYEAYKNDEYPQNVTGDDLNTKTSTFLTFAPYDKYICSGPCSSTQYDAYMSRQYITAVESTRNAARGSGTTVTASSQKSTAQSAEKARDGYALGAPMDSSKEWVTAGGKANSWIQYSFAVPTTLDGVTLFDRPNLNNQITGGTLNFSDGSSVPVGALPNNGSGMTISFPARTVTSVRLNITSVSATTVDVGLAEFEAYTVAPDTTAPVVTASPPGGEYAAGQQITLSANETADIYYTTDGTTPTTASTKYTAPLTLSVGFTLKFIGVDTARNTSAPATQTYTVKADTTAPVVTASPPGGEYAAGQQITL